MNQLSIYLEKFKNLEPHDAKAKKSVVFAFKKVLNTDIDIKTIKIAKNAIYINIEPALKSEAFIHKKELAECIEGNLGLI